MKFLKLTPAQRQAFNDDGFLIVHNALFGMQFQPNPNHQGMRQGTKSLIF